MEFALDPHDGELDAALREAFGSPSEAPVGVAPGGGGASRLGNYTHVRKLGEGGMGEVSVAFDETLERQVALKSIRAEHRLGLESRQRFLREARLLSQLDHPGICRIYDYIAAEDGDHLVLELVEGEVLTRRLGTPMEPRAALGLAEQVLEALAAAHAEGITHRDLKPANIMVTEDGATKILDFGIARANRDGDDGSGAAPIFPVASTFATEAGALLGTLEYMSPEQARGEVVTPASDLYSFGLILQELLTGRPARPAGLEPIQLWEQAKEGRTLAVEGLAADLTELLGKLLSPAPTQRPTAVEALERVRWILGKPRRRLVRSAVAVGLVLLTLGVVSYVYGLQDAYQHANARRQSAENLVGALLDDDLFRELEALGKLGVLEGAIDAADAYFDGVSQGELTANEQRLYATVFHRIGYVRLRSTESTLAEAREAFRRSLEMAEALAHDRPLDAKTLFTRGQSEFYLGETYWAKNAFAEVEPWWIRYRDTSAELARLEPDHAEYQAEVGYSLDNLAALYKEQREVDRALASNQASLEVWERLLDVAPEDADWWRQEVAQNRSWRADLLEAGGRLAEARDQYAENCAAWQQLVSEDQPGNRVHAFGLAIALHEYARLCWATGLEEEARVAFQEGEDRTRELVAFDAINADWSRHLAVGLAAHGVAHFREPDVAEAKLEEAVDLLDGLLGAGSDNASLRLEQAHALQRLATLRRDPDLARQAIDLLGDSSGRWQTAKVHAAALLVLAEAEEDPARASEAHGLVAPWAETARDVRVRAMVALTLRASGDDAEAELQALEEAGYRDPWFHAQLQR